MSRKTAALKEQPSLLDAAPMAQPAPAAKPVATTKPARKKTGTAVSTNVAPARGAQQLKNTAANTLAVIAEALKDPNFRPEAMKQVFDLQKEMVAEQARVDFINAFHALKQKLPRIDKDGKITIAAKDKPGGGRTAAQSTPFATYPNIRKQVDPLLDSHGFTMWDETEPSADGARINVIVHLDHNSGHGRKTVFPLPAEVSGSKNNVQGWGSSFSFGRRYGAVGILGIVTEAPTDRDNDGNGPNRRPSTVIERDDGPAEQQAVALITEKQADALVDLLEVKGRTRQAFCKAWHIEKVSDLPAEFLQKANDALKALPDAQ